MSEDERTVMQSEQILAMIEVMKDLEIKLVETLLMEFASVTAADDVQLMRTFLDQLARPRARPLPVNSNVGLTLSCFGGYHCRITGNH